MNTAARIMLLARRHRVAVLVAALLFAAGSAAIAARIPFGTDVLGLLPHGSRSLQAFGRYLDVFGGAETLYIVFEVPAGARVEDASPMIDAYVARIRQLPEIARVDAGMFDPGKDWTYLQERELVLIGPVRLQAALAKFEPEGMRASLRQSRDLLSTPAPAVRELVRSDPLGLLSDLRAHFGGDQALPGLDARKQGYLSADGRSRLVIASPTGAPFDSAFSHRLFVQLAVAEDAARREFPVEGDRRHLRVDYAGGHRIAVETEGIIRREAMLNGFTSLAAILAFLLVVFRSPWLFLVGALPMSIATLGSVAVNGLFHHQMSAAATGTSALLFGLGIDGLVLLYTRYLEELESGRSAEQAIARLGGAGASMLLGCFTTAATFLGLTWIDLPGLQELGRLVGIGMLLGGPFTLVLVAALLPGTANRTRGLTANWLVVLVRRRRWPILIACAAITVGLTPFLPRLQLDLRLQRLQPTSPAVQLEREISSRFGVGRDFALAVAEGPDLEPLLALDHRFSRELGRGAASLWSFGPSRLVPPTAEQQQAAESLRSAAARLPAIQRELRTAAFQEGFRPEALDTFISRLPRLFDPAQRITYDGYIQHGLVDLVSHYVRPSEAGLMTVSYVEIRSAADLPGVQAAADAAGAPLVLTGLPIVNAELTKSFPGQFRLGLAIGSVAVVLLLLVSFRSVRHTIFALVPTILGLMWSAAILAWVGVELDLFSVFGVLTLVGIGVDYGIHLVHRFASEPGGLDRALTRIAPANLVAAGIALLGCGSLITSAYPPMHSLGVVTVVSLCTCLLTAVLVLPALLMVLSERGPTRVRKAYDTGNLREGE